MPGPIKIMIVRHAEKPVPASSTAQGVDERGTPDPHSLTVRGWQRAGALVSFFATPSRSGIEKPDIIVASTRERHKTESAEASGRRAQQTVAPLQARISAQYWDDVAVGDEDVLVERLRESRGVVLVAWEHKRIHHIVAGFVDFVAPEWTADRFDAVWILDRSSSNAYALRTLNQDLLAGDLPA